MFSVVFCGTPDFAVPSLRAIAADGAFRVDLVVTQPDRPVGRKQTLTPPPVKTAAEALGIPVAQPEVLSTVHCPLSAPPDFLVVVAYGQILSDDILAWPRVAPVNVHASLLPRWRGASPIQHAILAGDGETGVTIQRMVQKLDAGPILAQERTPIAPRETFESLHDRLASLGAELLVATLKRPLVEQEQSEDGVTMCRKLARASGAATPDTMDAATIDRMVRGLSPWPGVTVDIDGVTVKVLESSLSPMPDACPLPCANGTVLFLVRVQPPSGKPMTGHAWAQGHGKK
ncbi:MAG: methionyl-tRNA formyltransferase fmt [Candidatus Peregrinibacteria bacterium Gr01-1014_25]|nr:MAG: methionyl-tRNA formyltransferase fmt [Candidatus Peregrinibacteria bacterium Gr01-1014_25]